MEALHDGWSRIQFLLEVFIEILFRGVQAFCILHPKVLFVLSYLLRWCYVIVDNFPSCFMIHKFSRVTYLNPSFSLRSRHLFNQSTSSLELSWDIFHLKLSLRIFAIYGAYKWPKFFIYPSGEISFSSPCSYQSNLLFCVSGRISPQDFEMFFISPLQACSFRSCFF